MPEKDINFDKELWEAADLLRGNVAANEYRDIILGLVFLKYLSDSFLTRQEQIKELCKDENSEWYAEDEEDIDFELNEKDNYSSANIFWIPELARWSYLLENANQSDIGKKVNDAMKLIEEENKDLKGLLPKKYLSSGLDQHNLGQIITLLTNITAGTDKDFLGRVYEYYMSKFAEQQSMSKESFKRLMKRATDESLLHKLDTGYYMVNPYIIMSKGLTFFLSVFVLLVASLGNNSAVLAHQQKAAETTVLFNKNSGQLEVMHRFYLHDTEHAVQKLFDKSADILRLAAGKKVIRKPDLPENDSDELDIDDDLGYVCASLIASYISSDKGAIHMNRAKAGIVDYNAKVTEIIESLELQEDGTYDL